MVVPNCLLHSLDVEKTIFFINNKRSVGPFESLPLKTAVVSKISSHDDGDYNPQVKSSVQNDN